LQPAPTTATAGIAVHLGGARRGSRTAEPRPDPRRSAPADSGIGRSARALLGAPGDSGPAGGAPTRSNGFLIQQMLAAMPELHGPPQGLPQTISAYQAHLAKRIHYSGPVRPVDLRV
jgi:hypothetical protein